MHFLDGNYFVVVLLRFTVVVLDKKCAAWLESSVLKGFALPLPVPLLGAGFLHLPEHKLAIHSHLLQMIVLYTSVEGSQLAVLHTNTFFLRVNHIERVYN